MKTSNRPSTGIGRALLAATFLLLATLTSRAADNLATSPTSAVETAADPAKAINPGTTTVPPDVGIPAPTRAKQGRGKTDHEKLMELLGLSLGIVATVMGIGIAFVAIWCDYRKRRDLITACHKERLAALEKGLEPPPFPPEILNLDDRPKPSLPGTGLKPGLVLLAVGIGLWMFLSPNNRGLLHPSVGAIPGAIGGAYLVYYVLEGRKRKPSPDMTRHCG